MIACKLAAMVPDRVLSLAVLNVTGGGFECFPKVLFPYHYSADVYSFLCEPQTHITPVFFPF